MTNDDNNIAKSNKKDYGSLHESPAKSVKARQNHHSLSVNDYGMSSSNNTGELFD